MTITSDTWLYTETQMSNRLLCVGMLTFSATCCMSVAQQRTAQWPLRCKRVTLPVAERTQQWCLCNRYSWVWVWVGPRTLTICTKLIIKACATWYPWGWMPSDQPCMVLDSACSKYWSKVPNVSLFCLHMELGEMRKHCCHPKGYRLLQLYLWQSIWQQHHVTLDYDL